MESKRELGNVVCSDTDGRSCNAEDVTIAERLINEFPVLLAQMTIPEIAEKARRLGIKTAPGDAGKVGQHLLPWRYDASGDCERATCGRYAMEVSRKDPLDPDDDGFLFELYGAGYAAMDESDLEEFKEVVIEMLVARDKWEAFAGRGNNVGFHEEDGFRVKDLTDLRLLLDSTIIRHTGRRGLVLGAIG